MSKTFTGGCACGAIRYACDGEPVYMGKCHSRDCQRATGSAFFPAVVVKDTDLLMLSGEARWYESKADRGHVMRRGFCANCGSPVFLVNGARANVIILYAGNLDIPAGSNRAATSSWPVRSRGTSCTTICQNSIACLARMLRMFNQR